jgi:3-hydroxyisobutyrate dehydrogenase
MPKQMTVAVLGAGGTMGRPMARNIARAGLGVRAWNRSPEKAQPLADDGVHIAGDPRAAVEGADVVMTMLADADAVLDVMGGAIGAMPDGTVWLQMSTIGEAGIEACADLASGHGIELVDAPVLGTKAPAEQGSLTVLASGPDEALDKVDPVFDAIGEKTIRLGDAGGGTRLKLVVNNWLLSLLVDLGETVAFAESIGVDPQAFLDAIDGGAVGSPYAQMKGPMMLARDFPTAFPLKLALKDLELVLEAADRHGANMTLANAAAGNFRRAVEQGHGEKDMSAVYHASADS